MDSAKGTAKQLNDLSKIYMEAVYGGGKKEEKKDTRLVVTAADKKANTPAYKNYKAGNKGYKAADHLKEDEKYGYDKDGNSLNPKDKKGKKKAKRWWDDDGDGIGYEKGEVKEGVYEKKKKEEVMGALKKRDLKDKVKKKIAADIVKKKGDTSKSDDRYAYESKLWDEVAAHLTELGNLNDADFRVEGYQRNPEKGEEEARKAKRERKGGYDEKRERRMNDPKKGINSPAFQEFMRSRGM